MTVFEVTAEERERAICATGRFQLHAGWYRLDDDIHGPYPTRLDAEQDTNPIPPPSFAGLPSYADLVP